MTKSSQARRSRRQVQKFTLPDGRVASVVHSPDPEGAMALVKWVLESDDPEALAARAELAKRDISGFEPPDVLAIRDSRDKGKPLTPAHFRKVAH